MKRISSIVLALALTMSTAAFAESQTVTLTVDNQTKTVHPVYIDGIAYVPLSVLTSDVETTTPAETVAMANTDKVYLNGSNIEPKGYDVGSSKNFAFVVGNQDRLSINDVKYSSGFMATSIGDNIGSYDMYKVVLNKGSSKFGGVVVNASDSAPADNSSYSAKLTYTFKSTENHPLYPETVLYTVDVVPGDSKAIEFDTFGAETLILEITSQDRGLATGSNTGLATPYFIK